MKCRFSVSCRYIRAKQDRKIFFLANSASAKSSTSLNAIQIYIRIVTLRNTPINLNSRKPIANYFPTNIVRTNYNTCTVSPVI